MPLSVEAPTIIFGSALIIQRIELLTREGELEDAKMNAGKLITRQDEDLQEMISFLQDATEPPVEESVKRV